MCASVCVRRPFARCPSTLRTIPAAIDIYCSPYARRCAARAWRGSLCGAQSRDRCFAVRVCERHVFRACACECTRVCETLYVILGSLDMPDGCSVGWYKPQLVACTFFFRPIGPISRPRKRWGKSRHLFVVARQPESADIPPMKSHHFFNNWERTQHKAQRPAMLAQCRLKGLFRAAPSNAESFLRLVHDMHQAQEAFVYTRE